MQKSRIIFMISFLERLHKPFFYKKSNFSTKNTVQPPFNLPVIPKNAEIAFPPVPDRESFRMPREQNKKEGCPHDSYNHVETAPLRPCGQRNL